MVLEAKDEGVRRLVLDDGAPCFFLPLVALALVEEPPLDDGQRGAAALHRVQAVATPKLVVHSGTCGHVGLFLEVELAVAKFLLVVDERPQRECLLLMVFVRGFQVRNMNSCLALIYKNDSQVRSMEKILRRINVTHAKKKNLS